MNSAGKSSSFIPAVKLVESPDEKEIQPSQTVIKPVISQEFGYRAIAPKPVSTTEGLRHDSATPTSVSKINSRVFCQKKRDHDKKVIEKYKKQANITENKNKPICYDVSEVITGLRQWQSKKYKEFVEKNTDKLEALAKIVCCPNKSLDVEINSFLDKYKSDKSLDGLKRFRKDFRKASSAKDSRKKDRAILFQACGISNDESTIPKIMKKKVEVILNSLVQLSQPVH